MNYERKVSDVLDWAAGPAGLASACELLKRGVAFRIFDQKAHPEPHSKAGNLWPRAQEALAAMGRLESLQSGAPHYKGITLYAYSKVIGHSSINPQDGPYQYPLQVGQNVIEQNSTTTSLKRGVVWSTARKCSNQNKLRMT
jgi:2-polyprenyl-6-methoxyphenol hydroxylase-like FAD-dependent oxidoreductase